VVLAPKGQTPPLVGGFPQKGAATIRCFSPTKGPPTNFGWEILYGLPPLCGRSSTKNFLLLLIKWPAVAPVFSKKGGSPCLGLSTNPEDVFSPLPLSPALGSPPRGFPRRCVNPPLVYNRLRGPRVFPRGLWKFHPILWGTPGISLWASLPAPHRARISFPLVCFVE